MPLRKRRTVPVDESGWRPDTPLIQAVLADDSAQVQRLVQQGADLGYRWRDNMTALHVAADRWHPGPIRALLDAGAAVDPDDFMGNAPLTLAVLRSQGRGECIRMLLDAGADPHHMTTYNYSPVSAARQTVNFDVAQYFTDGE